LALYFYHFENRAFAKTGSGQTYLGSVERKGGCEQHDVSRPYFLYWAPHIVHTPLQVPAEFFHKFAYMEEVRETPFHFKFPFLSAAVHGKRYFWPRQARDKPKLCLLKTGVVFKRQTDLLTHERQTYLLLSIFLTTTI